MAEKPPSAVAPSATLRLMMSNFQQNPAVRWTPGAAQFLGAFQAIVQYAEEQDRRIAQLEERMAGMDEVPHGLPMGFGEV